MLLGKMMNMRRFSTSQWESGQHKNCTGLQSTEGLQQET